MTNNEAINFQKDLMTLSDLAPDVGQPHLPEGAPIPSRHRADSSGSVTFEKLAGGELPTEEPTDSVRDSYVQYDPSQESPPLQRAGRLSSGDLMSSENEENPWLAAKPDAGLYRQFENPHASWQNAPLINPRQDADQRMQNNFVHYLRQRADSMNSVTSRDEMIGLLLRDH